jgi:uncharacterized protein YdhG (YjbR/CyaY superfamily)
MQSKATTVAEYLEELPEDRRKALTVLRALIRKIAPTAVEGMKYGMASYTLGDVLVSLGSQKQYMALYVCDTEAVDPYRPQLGKLDCGKGCIRFRHLEDLPIPVIAAILKETYRRRKESLSAAKKVARSK